MPRPNDDIAKAVETTLERLLPLMNEPLLWTLQQAQERTGLGRNRLAELFHAGEIEGLWSAGRGKGKILLKPESVRAFVDREITSQAYQVPA